MTSTTLDRKSIFHDFQIARIVVGAFRREDNIGHTKTLAFVVMPDHFHWLITLGDERKLSTVVNSASVARYIVANPLRAGLVKKIGDYPLWDAVWL